jgi:cytochrome P450
VREAAESGNNDYLEAVMKEAMRLHPVIPMVVRHLMEPASIGGWDLPKGTNLGPSILIAHQRDSNFEDPAAFRPARFLEGHVATNTWIPFGGGVRRCIGAGFSLMEGVAVLREVLLRYDVTLPAGTTDVPKVRNITSVPRHGARIVVHPR